MAGVCLNSNSFSCRTFSYFKYSSYIPLVYFLLILFKACHLFFFLCLFCRFFWVFGVRFVYLIKFYSSHRQSIFWQSTCSSLLHPLLCILFYSLTEQTAASTLIDCSLAFHSLILGFVPHTLHA